MAETHVHPVHGLGDGDRARRNAMLTDRMTAKILGTLVLAMAALIDVSCIIFARPETRHNPRFAVIVAVSSLPLFLVGAWLLRKAARMPDDREP